MVDFDNMLLSDIKSKKIIISQNSLNENNKQNILNIYKEDIVYIDELKNKFNYTPNDKSDK